MEYFEDHLLNIEELKCQLARDRFAESKKYQKSNAKKNWHEHVIN